MNVEENIKNLKDSIEGVEKFFLERQRSGIYKDILDIVEKPLIEIVLKQTDGNQKKAAKLLGINRNTLHAKIKKLKINVSKFKFEY